MCAYTLHVRVHGFSEGWVVEMVMAPFLLAKHVVVLIISLCAYIVHVRVCRLSERQAVEMVLAPFLLAMHYLHTRGIMHRDIKPENVSAGMALVL